MSYRNDFREGQSEFYWSAPRVFGMILLVVVFGYAIGFLATGGDLAIYRFWAPKQANAQREVFKNTQSFVDGKITHLSLLRLQYQEAEPGSPSQAALRTMIVTEAATVDEGKLPADLVAFVNSLKGRI